MKKFIGIIALIIVVIGVVFWYLHSTPMMPVVSDYKNTTYTIDSQAVRLVNGYARGAVAPGTASGIVTQYFGNEATGDLNGDGVPDVAFILTQTSGGGTFYYIVAALKTPNGYAGTNGVLLDDRIAPQTTEITNGHIVVNYADRNPGEPMTTPPSVGVTKTLQVQGTTLVEIPVATTSTTNTVGAGQHCGGNMANAPVCATGYHCLPVPGSHLPFGDVGGVCTPD